MKNRPPPLLSWTRHGWVTANDVCAKRKRTPHKTYPFPRPRDSLTAPLYTGIIGITERQGRRDDFRGRTICLSQSKPLNKSHTISALVTHKKHGCNANSGGNEDAFPLCTCSTSTSAYILAVKCLELNWRKRSPPPLQARWLNVSFSSSLQRVMKFHTLTTRSF